MIRFYPVIFAILFSSNILFAGESVRAVVVLKGTPLSLTPEHDLASINAQDLTYKKFLKSIADEIPGAAIINRFRFALNGAVVELPKPMLTKLRRMPGVLRAIEERRFSFPEKDEPREVSFVDAVLLQKSVPHVGAPVLHARSITGKGIKIAIIDTGIDWTHSDLGGGVGPDFKVTKGINTVDDGTAKDDNGHGTHVAAIAAGAFGVAPGAELWAIKVLDKSGSGSDESVIEGIERAMDFDGDPSTPDRADVINMSIGSEYVDEEDVVSIASDNAVKAGVVVVTAAGNSGPWSATIESPGISPLAITVGASSLDDSIADFSSRGPVLSNGALKPDIVAPGVDITSALPGNKYGTWSGTSMASPHVAGAAALVKEMFPGYTPQEIKSLLLLSSKNLTSDMLEQGYGRLQVDAADAVPVIIETELVSFGVWRAKKKNYSQKSELRIRNLTQKPVSIEFNPTGWDTKFEVSIQPNPLKLEAYGSGDVSLSFFAPKSVGLSPEGDEAFRLPIIIFAGEYRRIIPVCLVKW